MNIDTERLLNQPSFPTRKLWRALLTIYNYYLVPELVALRSYPDEHGVPEQVADALRLLDCWLDAAIDNDWFGSEEQVH